MAIVKRITFSGLVVTAAWSFAVCASAQTATMPVEPAQGHLTQADVSDKWMEQAPTPLNQPPADAELTTASSFLRANSDGLLPAMAHENANKDLRASALSADPDAGQTEWTAFNGYWWVVLAVLGALALDAILHLLRTPIFRKRKYRRKPHDPYDPCKRHG